MIKNVKFSLFVILCCTSYGVKAQIVDNFGIRAGMGIANQNWEYKTANSFDGWKGNRVAMVIFFNAEKNLNKFVSVRPEIGYKQKGYAMDFVAVDADGSQIGIMKNYAIFHTVTFNLNLKVSPLQKKVKPYLLLGLGGDYSIKTENYTIEPGGNKIFYAGLGGDGYNKFILNGNVGVGCSYNELVYVDFEYNPAITRCYETDKLKIRDRYFAVTVGVNINRIVKKQ